MRAFTKLKGRSEDDLGRNITRSEFQDQVCKMTRELWNSQGTVEEKWAAIKTALCVSAKSILGSERKQQPDWYWESSAELKPLFVERNRLYSRWLSTKRESDRKKFARMRKDARRAVREAKNTWFLRKAEEAQRGRHGGKIVWKCIRDIQRGRQGLVPVRSATIRNEEGVTCSTTELQYQR